MTKVPAFSVTVLNVDDIQRFTVELLTRFRFGGDRVELPFMLEWRLREAALPKGIARRHRSGKPGFGLSIPRSTRRISKLLGDALYEWADTHGDGRWLPIDLPRAPFETLFPGLQRFRSVASLLEAHDNDLTQTTINDLLAHPSLGPTRVMALVGFIDRVAQKARLSKLRHLPSLLDSMEANFQGVVKLPGGYGLVPQEDAQALYRDGRLPLSEAIHRIVDKKVGPTSLERVATAAALEAKRAGVITKEQWAPDLLCSAVWGAAVLPRVPGVALRAHPVAATALENDTGNGNASRRRVWKLLMRVADEHPDLPLFPPDTPALEPAYLFPRWTNRVLWVEAATRGEPISALTLGDLARHAKAWLGGGTHKQPAATLTAIMIVEAELRRLRLKALADAPAVQRLIELIQTRRIRVPLREAPPSYHATDSLQLATLIESGREPIASVTHLANAITRVKRIPAYSAATHPEPVPTGDADELLVEPLLDEYGLAGVLHIPVEEVRLLALDSPESLPPRIVWPRAGRDLLRWHQADVEDWLRTLDRTQTPPAGGY